MVRRRPISVSVQALHFFAAFVVLLLVPDAATLAAPPAAMQPIPTDSRGCLPLDDQRWFKSMDATSASAFPIEAHGEECLNELQFAEALPKLLRAARLSPKPCTLIALGVAYDGLSRHREAAEAWQRAELPYRHEDAAGTVHFSLGLESPLLHGDSVRAMRILKEDFEPKFLAGGAFETYTGLDRSLAKAFAMALEKLPQVTPMKERV